MKKINLLALFAGIITAQMNSHAQNLYIGGGLGYGFPSAVQAFPYPGSVTAGSTTTYTSQSISMGEGISIGAYGDYMLTRNFGFELGIAYKFSSGTSTTTSSGYQDTAGSMITAHTNTDIWTEKGSLFKLTPAIRLAIDMNDKIQAYWVTGIIFGFPSCTLEDNGTDATVITNRGAIVSNTTNITDEIYTYSGGIIIGFHGAIGVVYRLSPKIGIFGELFGSYGNWSPSEQLITTATLNGVDELSQMTTQQKQTNYESSYSVISGSSSPGLPAEKSNIYLPFSSFGINVGVHIALGLGGGSGSMPADTAK